MSCRGPGKIGDGRVKRNCEPASAKYVWKGSNYGVMLVGSVEPLGVECHHAWGHQYDRNSLEDRRQHGSALFLVSVSVIRFLVQLRKYCH